MDKRKLKEIGFTDKEVDVYLTLLRVQEATVSEIAKKTKINRSLMYSVLDSLAEKGISTYIIKNNVRYYRAAEPGKIQAMLKEKEKIFSSLLPELIALHKPQKKKPIVEILEGKEGIKTVLNDIMTVKKEWFAFNIPGKGRELLGGMVDAFQKERAEEGITLHVIYVKTPSGIKRGQELGKIKNTYVKCMPESYDSPASNLIYGDRIVIVFWSKEHPFAIRIIDKDLAESYKNQFKAVWNIAKKE